MPGTESKPGFYDLRWWFGKFIPVAVIAAFGFIWNINNRVTTLESPDSIQARISNLENLLLPVLIEYGVRSGLADQDIDLSDKVSEPVSVIVDPPSMILDRNAKEWATRQIYEQRALPEDSRVISKE